jgi:aspartate kinase
MCERERPPTLFRSRSFFLTTATRAIDLIEQKGLEQKKIISPMIVMKFGGTSVEDAASIRTVIELVRREQHRSPVVVVSAIAGTTNQLLESARLSCDRRLDDAIQKINQLFERHVVIAENLIDDHPTIQQLIFSMKQRVEALKNLCQGIALLGELTNRSLDAIASAGELLSSQIVVGAMKHKQLRSVWIDARQYMITDEEFVSAKPLFSIINQKLPAAVAPHLHRGEIVVTQGFIGSTSQGITSTLGRGGSDYSAAIIGAALDAEEIQIWTDVDGVLTADPRVAPLAQKINVLSFREASELAYFGAKVLHPSTILPAVSKNIPVVVLNTKRPEASGTRIVAHPPKTNVPVKSIATKSGITVINIQSTRMLMAHGFLDAIFSVFSRFKTAVDLVSTSEVAVSLTIDNTTHLGAIVQELEEFSEVTVFKDKAIVCVVGDQMHATPGVAAKVFKALGDINALMISQGASENNMSMVIDGAHANEAVRRLHKEFIEPAPDPKLFEPTGMR